jgi:hypothetical protein
MGGALGIKEDTILVGMFGKCRVHLGADAV